MVIGNHRLQMCRRSFSDVATRHGSFQHQISFQQLNKGWCWHKWMEIAPIWINLMSGICWWYLFHKYVKSSFSTAPDFLKPLLKCIKCMSWLNGWFFFFFFGRAGVNNGVFLQRESRPLEWRQSRLSTRHLSFCLHIYSLWFSRPLQNQENFKPRSLKNWTDEIVNWPIFTIRKKGLKIIFIIFLLIHEQQYTNHIYS